MTGYLVTLIGESREVYYVEADSAEQARERWAEDGSLYVQESSSMEVTDVREDD